MTRRPRSLPSFLIAAALCGASLLAAAPAAAEVPSEVAFTSAEAVTAPFGSGWSISISATSNGYGQPVRVPIDPSEGTVNVTLSGIGGVYAVGLPIQPGGIAYFSQPTEQPLLPPGTYQVTASFVPAAGSYLDPATSFAPQTLTITPLGLSARVSAGYEAGADTPIISATLEGAYVDEGAATPAGTWSFTAEDSRGTQVFEAEVAQLQAATEPVRVELDSELKKGIEYTVHSSFVPAGELAPGITVDPIADVSFTTPADTFAELVTGATPVPAPIAIALGLLLMVLAITTAVLATRLRGLSAGAKALTDSQNVAEGHQGVELVDMEFVGISPQLDGSPNWSLSADDNSRDGGDTDTTGLDDLGAGTHDGKH